MKIIAPEGRGNPSGLQQKTATLTILIQRDRAAIRFRLHSVPDRPGRAIRISFKGGDGVLHGGIPRIMSHHAKYFSRTVSSRSDKMIFHSERRAGRTPPKERLR
jgi:hypothetical protein